MSSSNTLLGLSCSKGQRLTDLCLVNKDKTEAEVLAILQDAIQRGTITSYEHGGVTFYITNDRV